MLCPEFPRYTQTNAHRHAEEIEDYSEAEESAPKGVPDSVSEQLTICNEIIEWNEYEHCVANQCTQQNAYQH